MIYYIPMYVPKRRYPRRRIYRVSRMPISRDKTRVFVKLRRPRYYYQYVPNYNYLPMQRHIRYRDRIDPPYYIAYKRKPKLKRKRRRRRRKRRYNLNQNYINHYNDSGDYIDSYEDDNNYQELTNADNPELQDENTAKKSDVSVYVPHQ